MAPPPVKISLEQACKLATGHLLRGNATEAERICRLVLSAAPGWYPAAELLAIIFEVQGRFAEALAAFETAARLSPGEGLSFSRATILRLRAAIGPPLAPRATANGADRISMTTLGSNGRFGNQLLQYAFLRLYAAEHGLVAEAPDWVGRDLFDLDDPLPSGPLPRLREDHADWFASLNRQNADRHANVDVGGFFCGSTAAWGDRRAKFRQLFRPGPKINAVLNEALSKVRSRGRTLVAIHLRRGDFGYGQFWVAPVRWYSDWLRESWSKLDSPVLFIASDDPNSIAGLAEFSPINLAQLGVSLPGAEFMIDHHILTHADHLAISNSTFSFTAAMLNERAKSFARPDPDRRRLAEFDPWNSPVLLQPDADPAGVSPEVQAVIRQLIKPRDQVLHVGEFCSQWTTTVRSIHSLLVVKEIEPETTVDRFQREANISQFNFVLVGDDTRTCEIIEGAAESLRNHRIKFIQFRIDAQGLPDRVLAFLAGYALHPISPTGIQNSIPGAAYQEGSYVAVCSPQAGVVY